MFKRQSAFEGTESFLKGALHIHTQRSDGELDAASTVRLYLNLGFDFLALTDHEIYNRMNHAPEVPITVIPGCEGTATVHNERGYQVFDSVMLGADDDSNLFIHDEQILTGNALATDGIVADQYDYQPYLDMIHSKGNITFYCHPEWSSTPAEMFRDMKGHFAMEIYNTGGDVDNDCDKNAAYWDEVLGYGNRLYGVAVDDSHSVNHCGGGWVMVKSKNEVRSILAALESGAFYSSCGPEIYDFYVEDSRAYIKCSPSAKVNMYSFKHPPVVYRGENITEHSFCIESDYDYVRISVTDENGKTAWTNPIFLK